MSWKDLFKLKAKVRADVKPFMYIPASGVYAISGKPGGGKSYVGTCLLIDILLFTDHVVVTNFPLNLDELNALVQSLLPVGEPFDIHDRVRILDDEQVREFYLYREKSRDKLKVVKGQNQKPFIDFPTENVRPIAYFLDEVHLYYNARAWASTGEAVMFYLSQHRKFQDVVFWVTQSIQNVDRQFRSLTQEFIYVRNYNKEMLNKWIRRQSGFTRNHFVEAPVSSLNKPVESHTFDLDPRVYACYNTMQGVGIKHKMGNVEQIQKKGISFKWLVVGFFALLLGGGLAIYMIPQIVYGTVAKKALIDNKDLSKATSTTNTISSNNPSVTTSVNTPVNMLAGETKTYVQYKLRHITPERLNALVKSLDPAGVVVSLPAGAIVYTAPSIHTWIKSMDVPFISMTATLQVHAIQDTKDSSFSLEKLTFPSQVDLTSYISGTLDMGSIVVKLARDKGHSVTTQTYTFNLAENVPFVFERGQEVPVQTTTTTSTSTTTTVNFKPVTSKLSMLFNSRGYGNVDLTLGLALQSLVDSKLLNVDTSNLSTTYSLTNKSSMILMNYTSLLNTKSTGLFSFSKEVSNITYIITLKLSPYTPSATDDTREGVAVGLGGG